MTKTNNLVLSTKFIAAMAGACLIVLIMASRVQAAACAPTTDYGSATTTVNIPSTGSYRVWSRMMADNATAANNSYFLEIDGNTCYVVGDNTALSGTSWTWIDYQNGSTTTKINHNFSSTGNHTVKLIGREPNVKVDRVIFTQDTACVPSGTGDNCASPPDTTPPTVSLSSPAASATVSGQVSVAANASDAETGIQKVAFYRGTTLIGEDTSSPYSVTWDTTGVANGSYNLTAKATNGQGLESTSAVRTVTVSNASPADLVVTGITMSPANPSPGQDVTFSATIKNQGGTATPASTIHGVLFKVDGTNVSWSDNSTDSLAPGASRTVTASGGPSGSATWNAVLGAHTISAQVDDVNRITEGNESNNTFTQSVTISTTTDTTAPTVSLSAPANGATVNGTISVSASASDNVGVTKVEFYVDGNLIATPDTTSPYSVSLNTTTLTNGSHSLTAKAYDQANNSTTSGARTINVSNITFDDADLNQDGVINLLDFSLLAQQFGKKDYSGKEDINRDGKVDILDFSILASRFGK